MSDILRLRNRFAAAAVGTALFAAAYECFSHQVYSPYMILAFLFPLLGGVIPYSLLLTGSARQRFGIPERCLYPSGIAVLTVGSLFRGILEIYGTTSRLSAVYWIAGASLLLSGLLFFLLGRRRPRNGILQ